MPRQLWPAELDDRLRRQRRDLLVALGSEIHEVQVQLSDLEKTTIIEQPVVGIDPVNVRPLLNTAIALVLGGMVALGVVFILEYFEKNPLQSS